VSRQIEIAANKTRVQLPTGLAFDAGSVVTLTDLQWSQVDQSLVPGTIIDRGEVRDVLSNQVTIAAGKSHVVLPNGTEYNAGEKVQLTGDQAAMVPASLFPGTVVNNDDKLSIVSIPLALAAIADGAIAKIKPGFAGKIVGLNFLVTTAVTTATKTTALNLDIAAVNLTGGVLTITSALATPAGAIISGTAVTAANVFTSAQTITVEAASTTAFVEGAGVLRVILLKS
jgi:hypothetical protein